MALNVLNSTDSYKNSSILINSIESYDSFVKAIYGIDLKVFVYKAL